MAQEGEKVVLDVVGEDSLERFRDDGVLRAKTLLTASDRATQDRIRREILGPEAGAPSVQASVRAEMLSQLNVRVTDPSPVWWRQSFAGGIGGMLLKDDNVIADLFEAVMAVDARLKRVREEERVKAEAELRADAAIAAAGG